MHEHLRLALGCVLMLFWSACAPASGGSAGNLGAFPAPDGSFKPSPDFSGGLDPDGFRLATDPDGQPRFLKAGAPGHKLFGVPVGCDGEVHAIAVAPSGLIYLGGRFTLCDDVVAQNIVAYSPARRRFQSLGSGAGNGVDGPVLALAVAGDDLYVGGGFRHAGGQSVNHVARWNGSTFSALASAFGEGVDGWVRALAVRGDDLFVGGQFTAAGGQPASAIARWRAGIWSALGAGMASLDATPPQVYALAVRGEDLYAGGDFDWAGSEEAHAIARWNGSTWSALGSGAATGVNRPVLALAVKGDDLYVGGAFDRAGDLPAQGVARWSSSHGWSALGTGVRSDGSFLPEVRYLAPATDGLLVAGRFTHAGNLTARAIARWDGSDWAALDSGIGEARVDWVNAVAASGDQIYAGGRFTRAGEQQVAAVARWDGQAWSALGSGIADGALGPGSVRISALAVAGDDLYVAGDFTEAAGQSARRIARWNGSAWFALGSGPDNGVNGDVLALAVIGNDLYAGGRFTEAGGQPANRIARWNGQAWSALGTGAGNGLDHEVYALAAAGDGLYVGGAFTQAGGEAANRVARWDGNAWSALGSGAQNGLNARVFALAVAGPDLYVGGAFSQAGGQDAYAIARWNGSQWSTLGSGAANGVFEGWVSAVTVIGSDVYVGGTFNLAAGQRVNHIARWDGSSWSRLGSAGLGSGVVGFVHALAALGGELYAAGDFTLAGGEPANGLARWDGDRWYGLAVASPPQVISALATDGTSLYAGATGLRQTPLPELQSATESGAVATGASRSIRSSHNGSRVVFASDAPNLVSGDTNNRSDVFLRDTVSGVVTRLNAPDTGVVEDYSSPAISADGGRVAFAGSSGQLYAIVDGQAQVLSRNREGNAGNGPSSGVQLPGLGELALFESQATNLLMPEVDGNGSVADIFLKNLGTGAVTLVSQGPNGEPANGPSSGAWASADGSVIGFSTLATNLAPGSAAAGVRQAVVASNGGGARSFVVVSRNLATGALGNGDSTHLRLTPDGRWGVFESTASNLVEGDSNGVADVFRFELNESRTALLRLERVSTSRYGVEGNGPSRRPSVCDNGQYVAFDTEATNLIELDRNGRRDVLVKWMETKEVVRLSRTVDGRQPNGDSSLPDLSGDCASVYFESQAGNLTANDGNLGSDVFAVDLREQTPEVTGPIDEPSANRLALPIPNPPNANCPEGYFTAVIEDGPGPGFVPGIFGMELLLDDPGTRQLQGGLNFGGLVDVSQVGFAGANIANAANEPQRLNIELTGSPASSREGSLPVRVTINRRTATTTTPVYTRTTTLRLATPFVDSVVVDPGYYEALVSAEGFPASAAGGDAEGQFYFSLTTSFVNRPGGGFQGGAVVGGYHAAHPFGGVSGFAGFCLSTPHSASIRVLSRPSYGPAGAGDLRLRVLDERSQPVWVVPSP